MNDGNIDWERLDRFVREAGSGAEQRALARWVASDPDLITAAAAMRSIGDIPRTRRPRFDASTAWRRVSSLLQDTPN